jgi:uncharacterized protein with HEPN domain
MKRDLGYVADIVPAARDIAEFLGGVSKDEFLRNKLIRSAVMRQLEIIGEATKRLSPEFRKMHPGVPWKDIAGLRDRLIHAYDDLDLDRVWDAATVALPKVRAYLEPLLPPSA